MSHQDDVLSLRFLMQHYNTMGKNQHIMMGRNVINTTPMVYKKRIWPNKKEKAFKENIQQAICRSYLSLGFGSLPSPVVPCKFQKFPRGFPRTACISPPYKGCSVLNLFSPIRVGLV